MKRSGRKSKSQTPAPKSKRIYGSRRNKPGSAKSRTSAKKIQFSEKFKKTIRDKVSKYNKANPKRKIKTTTAYAIVRRGMGAFSQSHRPTIGKGKPNSRQAWGLARLSAAMRKKSKSKTANGVVRSREIKTVYVQDDDLLYCCIVALQLCNPATFMGYV